MGNEDGNTGIPLKDGVMIPVSSIEKAPSAELRPGQKDSDSLPEYALLDKVLAAYIEHAHGRADLLADGFDQVTVDTGDAIGGPRRMEAPPIPAGTEGHGPRVRPRPPTARHQRIQGINIYCSRQREQVIPLRRYQ